MIANNKEHKLKKGTGFHLDILLMGLFSAIGGVFGLPFMACATVRSVSHISALTVISRNHAPGEQPKLERVIEQRLSNLVVHLLVGMYGKQYVTLLIPCQAVEIAEIYISLTYVCLLSQLYSSVSLLKAPRYFWELFSSTFLWLSSSECFSTWELCLLVGYSCTRGLFSL